MNKVVCVLYAAHTTLAMEVENWAHRIAGDRVKVLKEEKTLDDVLSAIVRCCAEEEASAAVFSYADCPFIDDTLTAQLVDSHFRYAAEYTFFDGYPYGFTPEVIDAGTAGILLELSKTSYPDIGSKDMTRTALFELIKKDINSFEVETLVAKDDWRLWRLSFCTGDKQGKAACDALMQYKREGSTVDTLCEAAVKDINVVRTVPGFYEVALTSSTGENMEIGQFQSLIEQMKELSEKAVVSLSADGEPLLHPAFVQAVEITAKAKLDILVETDGGSVTEDIARQCKDVVCKYGVKANWVVKSAEDRAVAILAKYFPNDVYPQMVRTRATEEQLEGFWRKWSAKDSLSGGKVLIKKYCSYCGTKNDEKPCDLSPLLRNPCWHLRRDMVILNDGTVPLCFARVYSLDDKTNIAGNAFSERLYDIWERMGERAKKDLEGERDDLCRKCDEYYTFNF